ncbi:MAG: hypothetical protein A3F69_02275 [Acidobacteria bacterium RIFCSPLOWO2_12_FULL_66_10]|nr:MAG: hypothetical protein A3F69_02275 [Acidobacteria bacterium RIFCSPLOWO2_12_FULL_66_10]
MSEQVIRFWEQAADQYRAEAYRFAQRGSRYPFYEARLALMVDMIEHLPKGKMLDAGCGGALMLLHFLDGGWDVVGIDGAQNMVAVAHENLAGRQQDCARVRLGNVTDLSGFADGEFDVVISAGVMEYLTEDEAAQAFAQARRVLKPSGHFLVENINGLFDVMTFNRFTVRFYEERVLPLFFPDSDKRAELTDRIRGLLTNPDKPDKSGAYTTTRDQVFTRAEIPLTFAEKAAGLGFRQLEQGFYRFHAVPPLMFPEEPSLEKVTIDQELPLSRHWIGNLMATSFVALLQKT